MTPGSGAPGAPGTALDARRRPCAPGGAATAAVSAPIARGRPMRAGVSTHVHEWAQPGAPARRSGSSTLTTRSFASICGCLRNSAGIRNGSAPTSSAAEDVHPLGLGALVRIRSRMRLSSSSTSPRCWRSRAAPARSGDRRRCPPCPGRASSSGSADPAARTSGCTGRRRTRRSGSTSRCPGARPVGVAGRPGAIRSAARHVLAHEERRLAGQQAGARPAGPVRCTWRRAAPRGCPCSGQHGRPVRRDRSRREQRGGAVLVRDRPRSRRPAPPCGPRSGRHATVVVRRWTQVRTSGRSRRDRASRRAPDSPHASAA